MRAFSRACEHVFTGEYETIDTFRMRVLQCILCAAVVVPLAEAQLLAELVRKDAAP